MIDFSRDEDTEGAVDLARRFAREQLAPQRREAEAARGVDAGVTKQASEIGFATLHWPAEHGGAGLPLTTRVQVLEELAAGDPGAALAIDGVAADVLRCFGGEAMVERHAGSLDRAAVVFDDRGALRRDGSRVTGTIPWLPADKAALLLVLDRQGLSVLTDGLTAEPVHGSALQAAGSSEWRVDTANAGRIDDAAAAARALAFARLHAAALMVGAMRASCEQTREYAVERVAFGKPIAHHQALAFLIVDMRIALDAARGLLHEAAWRADAGLPFEAEAAAAFVEASEAGMFVGPNGVQIYGAAGFMKDGPVEKPMRELRALSLLYGGVDAARTDAAQALEANTAALLDGYPER